jgi:hypothetical protein
VHANIRDTGRSVKRIASPAAALRCTTSSTHVNNNAVRNLDAFIVSRSIEMALRLLTRKAASCLSKLVGLQSEKGF